METYSNSRHPSSGEPTSRYGRRALDRACEAIQQAEAGARGNTLFQQAAAIFELVGGGEVDDAEAFGRLAEVGQAIGLSRHETRSTLRSARRKGVRKPRSRPDHLRPVRPGTIPPPPPPDYPRRELVDWLWNHTDSVVNDDGALCWLYGRGIDPEKVSRFGLARIMPTFPRWPDEMPKVLAWGTWGRAPEKGLRLTVPLYDIRGDVRSLIFRRVYETSREAPPSKSLSLKGERAGLVMANRAALALLRCKERPALWEGSRLEIVIVEGEPDFLTAATEEMPGDTLRAVFGICSGSWRHSHASMLPKGVDVIVATDSNETGDGYAQQIMATIEGRHVGRWRPGPGSTRLDGQPCVDVSDCGGIAGGVVTWNE